MAEPTTYIFKDDHVYTMVNGQVVSSVKESEFEPGAGGEGGVEMPEAPADVQGPPCPGCGMPTEPQDQYCPQCGTPLQGEGGGPEMGNQMGTEQPQPVGGQMVAHVTTPNGMKGRVLARVPSLWGEEVTIRFENGNIVKVPVDQRLTFTTSEETSAAETAAQSLEERLAAHFEQDKMSLVDRGRELEKIAKEASQHVSVANDQEAAKLGSIVSQAKFELAEVTAVIDAMLSGEQEAYTAPRSIPMVSQASFNKNDSSWLEGVHADMTREASERDYRDLMDTGPEAFVASLDSAQMADAATTRIMATREIEAKTAGATPEQQDAFRRMWLARVEQQRQAQLSSFKEEVRKEASSDTPTSAPDESLFL
jgi:hypothetical protein